MHSYGFRSEEEAFRLLVHQAGYFAVIRLDAAGHIRGWNCGAEALLGHKAEEAEGCLIDLIFTPEDRQAGAVAYELGTARCEGVAVDERWHLRRDGSRFWGRGVTYGLRETDGTFAGWGKVLRDATVKHQTHHALERRCEALDERAYHMIHDLRAPFRQVSIVLDLIERKLADKLDERERSLLAHARTGADQGLAFVNQWADAQRQDQTKGARGQAHLALQPAWHDAGAIFDTVASILGPEVKEAGAVLARRGLPEVYVDATGLLRVFQNLISNALRHGRGQPLAITACAEDAPPQPGGKRLWRLTVQDNGPGIPPERVKGLFEQGAGAGLAICRGIVEAHGGRIWADPDVERGAAIHFTLPADGPPRPREMGEAKY